MTKLPEPGQPLPPAVEGYLNQKHTLKLVNAYLYPFKF